MLVLLGCSPRRISYIDFNELWWAWNWTMRGAGLLQYQQNSKFVRKTNIVIAYKCNFHFCKSHSHLTCQNVTPLIFAGKWIYCLFTKRRIGHWRLFSRDMGVNHIVKAEVFGSAYMPKCLVMHASGFPPPEQSQRVHQLCCTTHKHKLRLKRY